MQVRGGSEPKYEDRNVAFRNTYYFRVFDYCADERSSKPNVPNVPRIDSLYRFRMTGKASTVGKKIKFESGTLKSYQIDPFGADITYDKRTGQFRFVSQQEVDQRAKREAAPADFKRPAKLRAEDEPRKALEEKATAEALDIHAKEEKKKEDSLEKQPYKEVVDQAAADADRECFGSLTRRRAFQILGPEGWRTFDQDDRLLMAMSSDASPIISVLKNLSKRVLDARSGNEVRLLPIVQERLRTVEAQRALEQFSPDAPSEEMVKTVLKAFNQSDGEQDKSE